MQGTSECILVEIKCISYPGKDIYDFIAYL